jgi:cathepsin L
MYTIAVFLLALVASINAVTDVEYFESFEAFKTLYGKTYLQGEEAHRFASFKQNLDFITNFDSATRGFTVQMNQFGDLTSEEFNSIYNGLNITRNPLKSYVDSKVGGVDVDWRTKGAVTGVKDQGQCGSCWSFSATGSMEAAHFFATGTLVSLSEQNLVDCSTAEGNQGCNGGLMDSAFRYVISNHGIDTEESYRYTATGPNACKYSPANIGATIASFHDVASGNEMDLQTAVMGSPTSVAIDASHSSFQFYKSGVYYEPACSSTQLDHGVLAVGYGTDGNDAYWIVKNSWGASWGNGGYLMMSRNRNNNCGIATAASYPKP